MTENGETPCLKSKIDPGGSDENNANNAHENDVQEIDPHYDPIISLPETEVPTLEEEEIALVNLRAKIYRYDSQESPPEWKERGTGNIKILHHKGKDSVRVVMRRDKTLKLCANHFITSQMDLKPSATCERAWVYSVKADYIDETAKSHLLAVKFANVENAMKWKDAWDQGKKIVLKGGTPNTDVPRDEKRIIIDDTPKLDDTFDEEKKNNFIVKEENEQAKELPIGIKEEIEETKQKPDKEPGAEVTEKLVNLNIKEPEEDGKGD